MTRVYRILRQRYSTNPLDGTGSYMFGGRWSSPGNRIAYTAEHLSLAMVEYFVHIPPDDPPKDLVVVASDIPDTVSRKILTSADIPPNWRELAAPAALASFGDSFATERKFAILIVPSALAAISHTDRFCGHRWVFAGAKCR